ncbi:MAG: hypothetical protein R3F14_06235 [Polyangiaceae bacterium]
MARIVKGFGSALAAALLVGCGGGGGETTAGAAGMGQGGAGGMTGMGGTGTSSTPTTSTPSMVTSASVGVGGSGGGDVVCDPPAEAGSLYALEDEGLFDIGPSSMCKYRGDVLLIVNTAGA